MTTENWISVTAAVIAFGSFLLALWQAIQAKKSSTEAGKAADRSATAAEESADSQSRIAKALEKMESRYSAPWAIRHIHGALYELVNQSDEPALQVRFEHSSPLSETSVEAEVLEPGGSLQFRFVAAMGSGRRCGVRWTRPSETEPRVWYGSVPPEPSK